VSSLRRSLLLIAVAAATLVGLTAGPALAGFSDSASIPVTIGTLTVAAPTGVTTNGTYCSTTTTYDAYGTASTTSTLHARASWTASTTTRGVSAYRVTAWFPDGSGYPVGDVPASTTTVAMDVDAAYASQGIRVTVTTLTSYGWTAQSPTSGALTC
jgi:hypothetical protein